MQIILHQLNELRLNSKLIQTQPATISNFDASVFLTILEKHEEIVVVTGVQGIKQSYSSL